ncbi:MAG: GNAT family N-acetyltransferase [Clostridia bacterium]|nr:GNAT family N-acetyltransferase [Clostridia bacterium]
MEIKIKFVTAAVSGALAALLIVLVRFADVAAIGPEGTSVGLARLNRFVFDLFGVRLLWYHITDWLGVIAILTAIVFAAAGLVQLIRRRSLFKVDREILLLGGLYLDVIGLYVLFERAVVNYRPIIMPDGVRPEASFPSSHTMIVCVIMGSAIMLVGKYIKRKPLRTALRLLCAAVIAVTVFGRLISGVHWFTDILGGLFIGAALLALYSGGITIMKNDFTIRNEKAEDYGEVENLVRESFWNVYRPGCSEHFVIHVLRDDPAFIKELDFVMEQDGRLIGQNMFMKTVINADDGRDIPVLTMGPICITPELKRRGYGKALLDYSLEKAAALGFGAVLFEGNIAFYGKSGFDYARRFGIRYHDLPEDADDSFFLCKELIPGYLQGVTGVYQTPQGYYVKDEDVEEFDKSFPPKEKLKLPGQLFE